VARQDVRPDIAPHPNSWSPFVAQQIKHFLRQFQGIEIVVARKGHGQVVAVPVHAPYMMQSAALIDSGEGWEQLAQRHQDRLLRVRAARDSAPAEVKAFLHRQFYAGDDSEGMVAQGRAELDEIRTLLQAAVDQGLVPPGEGRLHLNSQDLREWLKEYGIGVDCSAFVQQALTGVMEACHAIAGPSCDHGATSVVGWMTSRGVYRELTAEPPEGERFQRVPTPADARPGDVVVKNGHMRIVAATEPTSGGALILQLAESTAAPGIPCGQAGEEADIGPRLIQVTYPAPQRPVHQQTPLRKRLSDVEFAAQAEERGYVLGRLRALDRLCREHPAAEPPAATM
jgi:hypothetical protein